MDQRLASVKNEQRRAVWVNALSALDRIDSEKYERIYRQQLVCLTNLIHKTGGGSKVITYAKQMLKSEKKRYWLFFCVATLFSLLFVYGHSLHFFFWNEDFFLLEFVEQNTFSEYFRLSFTKHTDKIPLNLGALFRPISHYVRFKIGRLFFDLNPLPYRLSNLLGHFFNGILVAIYCQKVYNNRRLVVSFMTGGLFVINRVQLAPVYWISTNEITLTSFVLLSVLGYVQAVDCSKKQKLFLCLSHLSCALALLSKEVAVVLPVLTASTVLLRLDSKNLREKISACLPLWPQILLVLAFLGVRAPLIMNALTGGESGHYNTTGLATLLRSYMWGVWWNLETFVEPWRMILDNVTRTFSLFQPLYVSTISVGLVVAASIWLTIRQRETDTANPVWLGLVWFVLSALPPLASGVLTDYLFSLPSVGFGMIVAHFTDLVLVGIGHRSAIRQYMFFGLLSVLTIISAKLVVSSLEQTAWPVRYMPLTVETLKVARQQLSMSDRVVCLVNYPEHNWWAEEDLQAAFNLFVNPEIKARKLTTSDLAEGICPPGAPHFIYVSGEIIVHLIDREQP
jgi:hypothetical protein